MRETLWVGLGGVAGAIARYWVGRWITARLGPTFPYGTLVINVSGSFVLCLIAGILQRHDLSPVVWLVGAVGFLGAYTTFSTFSFETLRLLETGNLLAAGTNVGASVGVGLVAGALGLVVGRLL